jgi:hypothetical protein
MVWRSSALAAENHRLPALGPFHYLGSNISKAVGISMSQIDPTTGDFFNKIETAAATKVDGATTLEDLKSVAEISASIASAKKTNAEAKNYSRQLRLEGFKSLATFLVPVVSLITLLATILIQSYQLSETRHQNEDTQWRDLLTSIKGIAKEDAPDVTLVPRLKSFFSSARYAPQARDLSKRLLGQLTYDPGFRDLFDSIIGPINLQNIKEAIDVARGLRLTQTGIEARCLSASAEFLNRTDLPTPVKSIGLCGADTVPEAAFAKIITSSSHGEQLIQLRRSFNELLKQQVFLAEKIVYVLRENYTIGNVTSSDQVIDLSNLMLTSADLSHLDFSKFDLSNTIFNAVNLDGAFLTPRLGVRSPQFWSTLWWNADRINQDILAFVVANNFPYYVPDLVYFKNLKPGKDEYFSRIKKLCVPEKEFCKESNLIFGEHR